MPKVSVIIPAYKSATTICRALNSVLSQTHPMHEIIVVDDGSPDDQAEVIGRTYGGKVVLIRQANGKTSRARNTGIDRATGDFISFLDADDYWEPEKIERQLAIFTKHPDVGVVAGGYYLELPGQIRQSSRPQGRNALLFDSPMRARGEMVFCLATKMWTGTVIIRRAALGNERFVPGLEPAEDRDMWTRLVKRNVIYLHSEPLATGVLEPGSISRSSLATDCASMLKVVERHRDTLGPIGFRRWRSNTLYRWSSNDSRPWPALCRLVHSFLVWPLPNTTFSSRARFARLKRAAILLAQLLRVRPVPSDKG